jgi:23S rRNA (cytosine1962-C5)-methyltransferase
MVLITKSNNNYELLDSGHGEKLERFGEVILSRPDPQVLWQKALPESEWAKANAHFEKQWKRKSNTPASWKILLGNLSFILKLSSFKHVGVFPEQIPNWEWITNLVKGANRKISVLNLFGYTGGATLAALSAGAEVVHVDSSRVAISSAKENAKESGLDGKPVRWILDDVNSFLKREVRRGNKYDAIIMDPPSFGRGPEGEVWKIERDFLPLLQLSVQILSENPLFFLLNGYASGYSGIAYENALRGALVGRAGTFESGELTIEESSGKRLLPAGIFCRWKK